MPAFVETNGRLVYYRPQLYPLPPSPQQRQTVADAKAKTDQDITTVRSDINGASGASADGTSLDTSLPNLMAAVANELRLNADLAPRVARRKPSRMPLRRSSSARPTQSGSGSR